MNELFGHSRDVIRERYALRTPAGFVPSWLPGWKNCVPVVHISPEMGARFAQWEITFEKGGEGSGNTHGHELVIYLIAGSCLAQFGKEKQKLTAGSYAFVPPGMDYHFSGPAGGARLLVFEKKYQPLENYPMPDLLVGHQKTIPGLPFLGNKDARLQTLLPITPGFDLAVNIFTYQSGATLPLVETHVMEHGLMMLSGQGIYRLADDWHPVRAGDVIWMASYCPQWFVAMGGQPASYIYYKDVNRPVLALA